MKTQVNRETQNIKREIQKVAEGLGRAAREQRGKKQPLQVIKDGFYVGIDLGDKESNYCFLDAEAKIVAEGKLATTQAEMIALFSSIPKCWIAVEVGTHSPWVSALLESYGHEVFVANPRKMESIHKSKRKNDNVDARTLARLVRADPELLYPIRQVGGFFGAWTKSGRGGVAGGVYLVPCLKRAFSRETKGLGAIDVRAITNSPAKNRNSFHPEWFLCRSQTTYKSQ